MKSKGDSLSGRCYSDREMYELYILTIDSCLNILKYAYKNIYKAGSILSDFLEHYEYSLSYFPGYYIADESKAIVEDIYNYQEKREVSFEEAVASGLFKEEDGRPISRKRFNYLMGRAVTNVFYNHIIGTGDEKDFRSVSNLACVGDDREMLEDILACVKFSKEDLVYGVLHKKFFETIGSDYKEMFGFIEGNRFSELSAEINARTKNAVCKKLLKQGKLRKAIKLKMSLGEKE